MKFMIHCSWQSILALLISTFICNAQQSSELLAYLNGNSINPKDYIIQKFKTQDIVLLGEDHGVQQNTIYSHFAYLYTKDEPIDLSKYISSAEVNLVEKAWQKAGQEMALAAIAEHLAEPMEFHKIRLSLAVIVKKIKKGKE